MRHPYRKFITALLSLTIVLTPSMVMAETSSFQSKLSELNQAVTTAEDVLKTAQTKQAQAQSTYDEAQSFITAHEAKIEKASQAASEKKTAWESANSAKEKASQKKTNAQNALDKNKEDIKGIQSQLSEARAIVNSTAVADAQAQVNTAQEAVNTASANLTAAQNAINSETPDPGNNEGHKEWTAYGFFQYIRDNSASGSDEYYDAQCAMDILDGGANSTGHSYEHNQGPAPDGMNASSWQNIADNIAWAQRKDAVSLDNMKTSVELLKEFNSIRAEENESEGTNLNTNICTNCRQMAISIVQCDTSKDYSVSHTQAYEGLENLSWSSAKAVPFSRNQYTDPYVGWYDKEKVNFKENNGGVTGHYKTIVDKNSNYFCEIAGFAVCNYNASYGECRELSTFGDFTNYDTNPTPKVQYSVSEFGEMLDDYYNLQVENEMFGTPENIREAHQTALTEAQSAYDSAQEDLTKAKEALKTAQAEKAEAEKNITTYEAQLSSLQAETASLEEALTSATEEKKQADEAEASAKTEYDNAQNSLNALKEDATYLSKISERDAAKSVLDEATQVLASANTDLENAKTAVKNFKDLGKNTAIKVTLSGKSFTYTGKEIKPEVKVFYNDKQFSADNYTVSYKGNVNAGTGNVEIRGKGDCEGMRTETFTINKAASSVTASACTKYYSGAKVQYSGKVVRRGSTGNISYTYYSDARCTKHATPVNAGKYYVRVFVKPNANYQSASAITTLTINKASNQMSLSGKTKKLSASKLKKASMAIPCQSFITTGKSSGAITYKLTKVNKAKYRKYFSLNAKTKKLTVKKKLKKGTYKLTFLVSATGDRNHTQIQKSVTVKIQVK